MRLATDPGFEPYINGEFSMVVLTRSRAVEKNLQLHPRALALGILDGAMAISFEAVAHIEAFVRTHCPRLVTVEGGKTEDGVLQAQIEKAIRQDVH